MKRQQECFPKKTSHVFQVVRIFELRNAGKFSCLFRATNIHKSQIEQKKKKHTCEDLTTSTRFQAWNWMKSVHGETVKFPPSAKRVCFTSSWFSENFVRRKGVETPVAHGSHGFFFKKVPFDTSELIPFTFGCQTSCKSSHKPITPGAKQGRFQISFQQYHLLANFLVDVSSQKSALVRPKGSKKPTGACEA